MRGEGLNKTFLFFSFFLKFKIGEAEDPDQEELWVGLKANQKGNTSKAPDRTHLELSTAILKNANNGHIEEPTSYSTTIEPFLAKFTAFAIRYQNRLRDLEHRIGLLEKREVP